MDGKFRKPKPNPLATAGLVSKIFFWWLNPLFKIGYKRTIQEDDMYNVLHKDSSQKQAEYLQREWQRELDQATESPKRPPSLKRALFRVFGAKYLLLGLCTLLWAAVTTAQPIVLAWLIDYFSPESTVTTTQAYLYALIISVCALAVPVIQHPYLFALMMLGWRMRVACCGLIYRKTLKLSHTALGKSNTGQIVNLMSNDVNRLDQGFMFMNYLWVGPLLILTVTILLYRDLGPSCLAGLGFMLVQLGLSSAVGKVLAKYRSQTAQKTDSRIRTMSEIIAAMRVIKMYAWEKPFSELVANLRKLEIRAITKAAMCRGLNMTISSVSIRMVVFFTFVTFALAGNKFTAGVIFGSIGLYNILQLAVMTFIPLAIAQVSEALVSIRRIQKFLLLEEVDCPGTPTSRKSSISVTSPQDAGCSILLNKVTAKWEGDSDQLKLKNINLKLRPGQLLAVIGPVGSGKSSLLSAMLQELPVMAGEVKVRGKTGYASQQPWVFSGTVRQNILFGRPYEDEAYEKTIQVCALEKDVTAPLLVEEDRMTGTVGWNVYRDYLKAGVGVLGCLFAIILNIAFSVVYIMSDWWLAYCALAILMTVVVTGVINPWVFIPTLPLLLLFMYIRNYYLSTSRDIKRLEGTTRSPVFSHLSATLQGLWTIRAFGAQESFQQEFDAHQDLHSEAWFLFLACSRWLAVRVDLLAALFVTSVAFCSVLASQGLDGGLVGLSVTYAIILTGRFQWVVRQSAEVENLMTSAERVVTYTKLEPEAPLETSTKPPRDWPQDGSIELEAASFSYSEDGPDILKNLCLRIRKQEKIGIVGRTGAGKSSLMQMLFRMAEPQGTVRIDGVDVTKIGLHDLRKKISVIPQDPVLFSGSLRRNLDPFNDFTDQQLWSVIEEVQLKQAVEDLQGKLESEMAESGTNFSVGQRQLVCLARALLRKNRILIIDEATANVDPRTDQLIQETIREKFKNCTVLTIAHRLNTVIDSDRIMASHSPFYVLQEGRVQEMGEAHALLQDRDGVFTAMVDQSGNTLAAELREAARRCYKEKHGTNQVLEDRFVPNVEFLTSV
ncbi:ABCC4 [Branchiostoma lanceolatum]|uniref:ABCC4 protein n=1 Tax=Branchiostoma lanceolatum TaxID=7740 RepID=A0A8K0E8L2_BRALA|nr:ABCC4 [Branchiostoma lanceolatum]